MQFRTCLRLAVILSPLSLGGIAEASWTNSSGGQYGSADAACKAMIDPGSAYGYSHTEPKPGDPSYVYCFSKPKDGKGEPSYIGAVSKDEDVVPPSAEQAGNSPEASGQPAKPEQAKQAAEKSKDEVIKTRAQVRTHLHHVFPQKFYGQFKAIGIDVDDYLMQLPVEQHIGKNGVHVKDDYNGRWEDFFNQGGKRTKQEAEAYLIEILNEMGIAAYPIGSVNTGEVNTTGVR